MKSDLMSASDLVLILLFLISKGYAVAAEEVLKDSQMTLRGRTVSFEELSRTFVKGMSIRDTEALLDKPDYVSPKTGENTFTWSLYASKGSSSEPRFMLPTGISIKFIDDRIDSVDPIWLRQLVKFSEFDWSNSKLKELKVIAPESMDPEIKLEVIGIPRYAELYKIQTMKLGRIGVSELEVIILQLEHLNELLHPSKDLLIDTECDLAKILKYNAIDQTNLKLNEKLNLSRIAQSITEKTLSPPETRIPPNK